MEGFSVIWSYIFQLGFLLFVSGFSVIHRITKACSAGDGISHFFVNDFFFLYLSKSETGLMM